MRDLLWLAVAAAATPDWLPWTLGAATVALSGAGVVAARKPKDGGAR